MHIVRVRCPALSYLVSRHTKLATLKLDTDRESMSMICALARAAPPATLGNLMSRGAPAMSRSRDMLLVKSTAILNLALGTGIISWPRWSLTGTGSR